MSDVMVFIESLAIVLAILVLFYFFRGVLTGRTAPVKWRPGLIALICILVLLSAGVVRGIRDHIADKHSAAAWASHH